MPSLLHRKSIDSPAQPALAGAGRRWPVLAGAGRRWPVLTVAMHAGRNPYPTRREHRRSGPRAEPQLPQTTTTTTTTTATTNTTTNSITTTTTTEDQLGAKIM